MIGERAHAREDGARLVALRNAHPEVLLDAHRELERVERIEPQGGLVVAAAAEERGVVVDRLRIAPSEAELGHDETLDFETKVAHGGPGSRQSKVVLSAILALV